MCRLVWWQRLWRTWICLSDIVRKWWISLRQDRNGKVAIHVFCILISWKKSNFDLWIFSGEYLLPDTTLYKVAILPYDMEIYSATILYAKSWHTYDDWCAAYKITVTDGTNTWSTSTKADNIMGDEEQTLLFNWTIFFHSHYAKALSHICSLCDGTGH